MAGPQARPGRVRSSGTARLTEESITSHHHTSLAPCCCVHGALSYGDGRITSTHRWEANVRNALQSHQ